MFRGASYSPCSESKGNHPREECFTAFILAETSSLQASQELGRDRSSASRSLVLSPRLRAQRRHRCYTPTFYGALRKSNFITDQSLTLVSIYFSNVNDTLQQAGAEFVFPEVGSSFSRQTSTDAMTSEEEFLRPGWG